ncbi:MAG: acyltransferase [Aquabacterium sp.]|nr:acyltransferase [Aquabacterium sp.]
MSASSPSYRPDIDGLRAVAVLSVIAFHAAPSAMPGGFVGVDIFFVISGFLISRLILQGLDQQRFTMADFYKRRVRRIAPTLLIVMLFSLVLGWFLLFAAEYAQLARHIAASAAFAQNVNLWQESGYFDHAADTKPMLHLWSLAVEEQFYIVWPLLLAALWKRRQNLLPATMALGLLSFGACLYLSRHSPSAAFYLPVSRFWELMLGACGAHVALYRPPPGRYANLQSLVGALLIAGALLFIDKHTPFPGWWALLPTGGALLIIHAGPQAFVNKRLLSIGPLVALGLISYPLYLWHWPLLSFLRIGSGGYPPAVWIAACLLAALILAWISTTLVERRIRAAQDGRHVPTLLALLGTTLAVACLIAVNEGLPERTMARKLGDGNTQDVFAGARQSDGSCSRLLQLPPLHEEICLSNAAAPRLLVAGDSHAMALYASIRGRHTAVDALLLSAHGCELYPELTYAPSYQKDWGSNCTDIARRVQSAIRSMPSIDTILLVNHYPQLDEAPSPYRSDAQRLSKPAAFLQGLSPLITEAEKAGKQIVFVVDVPYLKQDPATCIQRLPWFKRPSCRYSLAEHLQLRQTYLAHVRQLQAAHPRLRVYDPTHLFCPGNSCLDQLEGHALYNDANHISPYASGLILRDMQTKGLVHLTSPDP